MGSSAVAVSQETEVKTAVQGYFDAANRHDIDAALAHLAPDFTFVFSGADMTLDRDAVRKAMGWDAGTNGSMSYEIEKISGAVATLRTVEQNEFLRLLELGPLHALLTVEVNDDGLIRRMKRDSIAMPGIDGMEVLNERLAPAVEWIEQHHPEALEEIYPGGRLRFTRESGERWVELLRAWRMTESAANGH